MMTPELLKEVIVTSLIVTVVLFGIYKLFTFNPFDYLDKKDKK